MFVILSASSLFGDSASPELVISNFIFGISFLMAILVNAFMMIGTWVLLLGLPISSFLQSAHYFKRVDGENKSGFTTYLKASGVAVGTLLMAVLISRLLFIEILHLDTVYSTSSSQAKFGTVIVKVLKGDAFLKN